MCQNAANSTERTIRCVKESNKGEISMKEYLIAIALATVALALQGCAYNVQTVTVPVVNVQASYDSKISGKFALVLDDSLKDANRQVKPGSYVCSAHSYPVSLGTGLSSSLQRMFEQIFEEIQVRPNAPTTEALGREGLRGTVVVRLEEFAPRINCQMGFFSGNCTAYGDLAVSVNVRGASGTLFSTSATGTRVADGSAGGACEGGAVVLGDAINRSMRDLLERLGERVSNSPRLRDANVK